MLTYLKEVLTYIGKSQCISNNVDLKANRIYIYSLYGRLKYMIRLSNNHLLVHSSANLNKKYFLQLVQNYNRKNNTFFVIQFTNKSI